MFQLSTQLTGEALLFLSEFLDRLKASIINRRWIGHDEYYEIRRGN